VLTSHQGLLIVDKEGNLEGLITRSDLRHAFTEDPAGNVSVLDAGTRNVVVAYPDETLYDAAIKMLRSEVGRLPVVDRSNPRRIVGYIGRPAVMAAHRRRFEQEHVREPGWISRWRRA
jgi:CBS domain-containing protein